jgi:hypothetical protein
MKMRKNDSQSEETISHVERTRLEHDLRVVCKDSSARDRDDIR